MPKNITIDNKIKINIAVTFFNAKISKNNYKIKFIYLKPLLFYQLFLNQNVGQN